MWNQWAAPIVSKAQHTLLVAGFHQLVHQRAVAVEKRTRWPR